MRFFVTCVTSSSLSAWMHHFKFCRAEEIAAPYFIFKEAGYDITIASIKGGQFLTRRTHRPVITVYQDCLYHLQVLQTSALAWTVHQRRSATTELNATCTSLIYKCARRNVVYLVFRSDYMIMCDNDDYSLPESAAWLAWWQRLCRPARKVMKQTTKKMHVWLTVCIVWFSVCTQERCHSTR